MSGRLLMFAVFVAVAGGVSVGLSGGGASSQEPPQYAPQSSNDCRTFTGGPTVSPSPDPTAPWMPTHSAIACNNTARAVSDLHFTIARASATPDPVGYASTGCPEAEYTFIDGPSSYTTVHVD